MGASRCFTCCRADNADSHREWLRDDLGLSESEYSETEYAILPQESREFCSAPKDATQSKLMEASRIKHEIKNLSEHHQEPDQEPVPVSLRAIPKPVSPRIIENQVQSAKGAQLPSPARAPPRLSDRITRTAKLEAPPASHDDAIAASPPRFVPVAPEPKHRGRHQPSLDQAPATATVESKPSVVTSEGSQVKSKTGAHSGREQEVLRRPPLVVRPAPVTLCGSIIDPVGTLVFVLFSAIYGEHKPQASHQPRNITP